MRWAKLGRVYAPDGSLEWMTSHAYVPTPHLLDDDMIRVYVAFLDSDRVGRVGFVDVAAEDPLRILRVSERPAFDVGAVGAFDEHGVTPTTIIADGRTLRLYYIGWQRALEVPYLLFGGLAASEDGGETFARVSRVPVLPRADGERMCRSAPSVVRQGSRWRAWYVAADAWTDLDGRLVPTYDIRSVSSSDGVRWERRGTTAVALANDDEIGLGRPFVWRSGAAYQMWYSIRTRSRGYRIGLATSVDSATWTRRDEEAGIDVSASGWDSEMVCFGAVLPTRHGTYLFYNGNRYGETGFGAAVLDGS
ncbi:MAG TPA: hypothetical protein VIM33_06030 [Gaiellaceae bacterium]|jgi:hypothetical protein